jgi:hypothetical protein
VRIRSSAVLALASGVAGLTAVVVGFTGGGRGPASAAGAEVPAPASVSSAADPPPSSQTAPFGGVPHRTAFTISLETDAGAVRARVAPIRVASGEPVQPPEGSPAQWNTAVWVQASAYPSATAHATTYVYGHACHHHLCPFTPIQRRAGGGFTVHAGDRIVVTTSTAQIVYAVTRVAAVPKTAATLPLWVGDGSVPNRLVLVTCEYEDGDQSLNDIVVVARPVPAAQATAADAG